jgi:hypothetical protein
VVIDGVAEEKIDILGAGKSKAEIDAIKAPKKEAR